MQLPSLIVVLLQLLVLGGEPEHKRSTKEPPRITKFSLTDAQGKTHTAKEWEGRKGVVLLFLGTECPVSNGYAPEMQRLAKFCAEKNVALYGIHPDPDVTEEIAANHAAEYRLAFTVLLDAEQIVAQQAGVRVTPEAVVLSSDGKVLYRGRIDDRYTDQGKRRFEPTTKDLQAALDAVLTGKAPATSETKAFGCPLPPKRMAK